jgi:hypothetical protein
VVGAKILSGGGPGFTGIAYRSTDPRLSFAPGGKGLFVQSATPQCNTGTAGLDVKQFDRIDLGGFGNSIADSSVIISPGAEDQLTLTDVRPARPLPCEGGPQPERASAGGFTDPSS